MIDYDAVALEWLAGRLEPSIGRAAWEFHARSHAATIAATLRIRGARRILEAGSGVGRLTPHLAALFDHVIACDTAMGMVNATTIACEGHENVTTLYQFADLPYPKADAAVAWDVIDSDWSYAQADGFVDALLLAAPLVLVESSRLGGWAPSSAISTGLNWWLLRRPDASGITSA